MKLACNVGGIDRGTRLVLGAALILIAYLGLLPRAWLAAISYAGGAVLFMTAVSSWCPLNQLIGINTCSRKANP